MLRHPLHVVNKVKKHADEIKFSIKMIKAQNSVPGITMQTAREPTVSADKTRWVG